MFSDVLAVLFYGLWIVGAASLLIVVRAIIKGAPYIAASNIGWGRGNLSDVFGRRTLDRLLFQATPFAVMIVGCWAGYAIVADLLWPLGQSGFMDKEDGEWKSYRDVAASALGGPLGLTFSYWLVTFCQSIVENEWRQQEKAPIDQLREIVGG